MARRRPNPEQAREAWDREVRSLLPAASEETLREVIDHCVSESPRGPGPRARTRAGLIRSMAGLLEDPEDDAEERRAEREGCGRQRDGTVPALFLTCQNLLTPRRARADDWRTPADPPTTGAAGP